MQYDQLSQQNQKVVDDLAKLIKVLPQNRQSRSFRLKNMFSDESVLLKASVIYALMAIRYGQKKIVLSLPTMTIQTIPRLL